VGVEQLRDFALSLGVLAELDQELRVLQACGGRGGGAEAFGHGGGWVEGRV
jgi:hypothetical protein